MLERRKHDRFRSFVAGHIACGSRRATLDCVVRDLSEGGALLLLDQPRNAPSAMDLALRGGTRPAQVVWRCETALGVSFTPTPSGPPLRSATVVSLDAARRARLGDEARLAERIARFVRRPDGLRS